MPSAVMNRRNFLAGAGLAGLARLNAGTCPVPCPWCTLPKNEVIEQPLSNRTVKPLTPPRPRPLWSCLSHAEKEVLAAKMRHAYAKMAKRSDRRGLLYQAWLHAWYCDHQDVHSNWTFLLWHRGFIYFHERLLRSYLPHDPDFRLPVWDWENSPSVPWMYNPFPVNDNVSCDCKRNDSIPPITDPGLVQWLQASKPEYFIGYMDLPGQASRFVHNNVHGWVSGFMGNQPTAAWDPVFYGHHANVDRYWCYWQQQYDYPAYGPDNNTPFYYFDETGKTVQMKTGDLLDTRKLGYYYDQMPTRPVLNGYELVTTERCGNTATISPDGWATITAYLASLPGFGSLLSGRDRSQERVFRSLAEIPSVDLICDAEGAAPGAENGTYYSIEMSTSAEIGGVVIGGFCVFMGEHHKPHEVRPTIYLGMDAIALIARSISPEGTHRFSLFYGPAATASKAPGAKRPSIDGKRGPFNLSKFAIRIPTGLLTPAG